MSIEKALAYPQDRESIIPHRKEGLLYDLKFIHLDLLVESPDRQRKSYPQAEMEELSNSIERHGLIQPIVVEGQPDGKYLLIAGARRLRAIRMLIARRKNWPTFPTVPCVIAASLSGHARKLLELEENIKRQDLHWKDEAEAVLSYLELRQMENPDYTVDMLCISLSMSESATKRALRVARCLREEDPLVVGAANMSAADNAVSRSMTRATTIELANFESTGRQIKSQNNLAAKPDLPAAQLSISSLGLDKTLTKPAPSGVQKGEFISWANAYNGEPFSFIHCDFPYGVGMQDSDQASSGSKQFYQDDERVYHSLLDALIRNAPRLMAPDCHIMFWFSMSQYTQTLGKFKQAGFRVNPMPLIWFKSNKMGILPDAQRGPRQVYETALLVARGDPKIVRAVANCHPHPSPGRAARHPSEKPMEMLAYFFDMLVDSSTQMLDPTCGCGGALAAAVSRGAKRVLGIELDPAHVEMAQAHLTLAQKNPNLLPKLDDIEAISAAHADALRDIRESDLPPVEDDIDPDFISIEDLGELDLTKLGLDDD